MGGASFRLDVARKESLGGGGGRGSFRLDVVRKESLGGRGVRGSFSLATDGRARAAAMLGATARAALFASKLMDARQARRAQAI